MSNKMEVEVRSGIFVGKDIKAKRGDKIMVPIKESEQSKGIREGLKSGRLVAVRAVMDTAPAPASPGLQDELDSLRGENEELKKSNSSLKGQVTRLKNAQTSAETSQESETEEKAEE